MRKKKTNSSVSERGKQIKVKASTTLVNFKTKTGKTIQIKAIKTEKVAPSRSVSRRKTSKRK